MYNSSGEYPITHDLLLEFIQDANKKSGLLLEYEIEYGGSDVQSEKLVSKGLVNLNIPFKGQINILDESKNNFNIFTLNNNFKLFGNSILCSDEICLLEKVEPEYGVRTILGFIYCIVLGLDHAVTVSVDQNGTDWTGYLGG